MNAEKTTAPILLTSRDAALALTISERTLWGLTAAGKIPVVRIGRNVRYTVADVEAYVASVRKIESPSPSGQLSSDTEQPADEANGATDA